MGLALAGQITTSSGFSGTYLIIVLVVGVVFGVICGKLVQGGDYPFWLGFVLGFFLGLIGLIIAIVLHTSDRGRSRRSQMPMVYPPDYYYQQQENPMLARPAAPPDHAYQQGAVVCSNCKAAVPSSEVYCWNCGSIVGAGTPPPPQTPQLYAPPQQYAPQQLPQAAARNKVCSLCHYSSTPDTEFCPNCGSALHDAAAW